MAEPGRLVPPFPVEHCANNDCERQLDDEVGAYLFKNHETDKLCVFCGDCARYVELIAGTQFSLIAL